MKRSPLKRRTPLRARRAAGLRRSERARDVDWMAVVRTMTCCARGLPGHRCEGPIEADHAGTRPAGRKASDDTTIPLCRRAHRERTDFSGVFRDWTGAEMREWLDAQIVHTQALVTKLRERAAAAADREPPSYRFCWACGRRLSMNHPGVVVDAPQVGKVRVHDQCVPSAARPDPTASPTEVP